MNDQHQYPLQELERVHFGLAGPGNLPVDENPPEYNDRLPSYASRPPSYATVAPGARFNQQMPYHQQRRPNQRVPLRRVPEPGAQERSPRNHSDSSCWDLLIRHRCYIAGAIFVIVALIVMFATWKDKQDDKKIGESNQPGNATITSSFVYETRWSALPSASSTFVA